jgi:serralysin
MTPRCSHKLPDQLQFRDADVHSDRSAKRNGAVFIWDSWQASGAHTVSAAGVVPASWHIANAGDFDSNRHADILWRNNNGAASIWDNGQIGNAHIIANAGVIPTSWHIAGVGDFGGNGHADILWHNDNGAVSIWDNGQTANAHVIANAGVQSSWHIV